jgi:DNA-binding transcriptional LysR family regulator
VEVELRSQRSIFLLEALEVGEIDLALVTSQPDRRSGQNVRREPLVWVCGLTAHFENDAVFPLALLPEGSVYRAHALAALAHSEKTWRIVSVSDSLAGLQASIFAGMAISVFPACAIQPGMRILGQAEGLPDLPTLNLKLLRRTPELSEATKHLADYIVREIGSVKPFLPWQAAL